MKSNEFEQKVKDGLVLCGVDFSKKLTIGAAVSGGADSISLLVSLKNILPENIRLVCVTVNHNIRPEEETKGDADYVQQVCKKMGIEFNQYELPRGQVLELSKTSACGLEDAARRLRYDCFESFMQENAVDFLCLAHNFNDQTETILMRFFQGSGAGELSGIARVRGKYIRPLLNISRLEIEQYLAHNNIPYRTDLTNFDNSMLRNCIRNKIVPCLNNELEGWQTALKNLSVKCSEDEIFIQQMVEQCLNKADYEILTGEMAGVYNGAKENTVQNKAVVLDYKAFCCFASAVKRRIINRAIKETGASSRVPFAFVQHIENIREDEKLAACGIEVSVFHGKLVFQKALKVATESSFFVIIERVGRYEAGPWNVEVYNENGAIQLTVCGENSNSCYELNLPSLEFPFALRSRQTGDVIKAGNGSYKSLSKILKDWKAESYKDDIILVQSLCAQNQDIICLWGQPLGFDNWIVK